MGEQGAGAGVATAGWHRPRLALATLSLVLFLTFLDNTIVSVVLANVQTDLHAGIRPLQWTVNGYALAFASLMLAFGRFGDLFGRKKIMLIGVSVFCAGSVLGALAPNMDTLIAARVIMGVGAAASEPGTLSMIRQLYPDRRERAQALGVWAAVSGLALAAGPVIGAVLTGLYNWRAIFWFNLLFGIVAFAGAAWVLPETSDPEGKHLDMAGVALGAVTLASFTFAVILGETNGYHSGQVVGLFVVALVAAILFVIAELRSPSPILDVRYLLRPVFTVSNTVVLVTYFAVLAIFFMVALYLQLVGSVSPYGMALDFVPMAVMTVLASVFTGKWVAARGPRWPMATGCALAAAGIVLTDMRLGPSSGVGSIGWTLAIAGVGFGMAIVPVTSAVLSSVPAKRSGMAASATNTSRELGAVIGTAVLGSMVNGQLTVDLIHRLSAIRKPFPIPHQFFPMIITAVTTGNFSQQAAGAAGGNKALQTIINEVSNAAASSFGHSINIALDVAAGLLLAAAVLALATIRVRGGAVLDFGSDSEESAGSWIHGHLHRERQPEGAEGVASPAVVPGRRGATGVLGGLLHRSSDVQPPTSPGSGGR